MLSPANCQVNEVFPLLMLIFVLWLKYTPCTLDSNAFQILRKGHSVFSFELLNCAVIYC